MDASSTPIARVDGEWLFDSKDIAKKLIEMHPDKADKVIVHIPDGVDDLNHVKTEKRGDKKIELQTFATVKWCAAPHGSKTEADLRVTTDESLRMFEAYLGAMNTPFFAGQQPGNDDVRHGNTLRNFKWLGTWCKGRNYYEDFPLLSAYADRWASSNMCKSLSPTDSDDLSFDLVFCFTVAFSGFNITFCDLSGANVLKDEAPCHNTTTWMMCYLIIIYILLYYIIQI